MSNKQTGKPAADEKPIAQTQVATAENEADEVPDERDQAELEAARQADQASQEPASEPEPEPEQEAPEVVAVRQALQTFENGITEREQRIAANNQRVVDLQAQVEKENETLEEEIDNLRNTLRTKFGGLFGASTRSGSVPAKKPGPKPGNAGAKKPSSNGNGGGAGSRQRTNYGDGNSTGDLIAACLKKSNKPVNSEQLTAYLKKHNNTTNPSVELSRMVAKGLVVRPSRGYYEWAGE